MKERSEGRDAKGMVRKEKGAGEGAVVQLAVAPVCIKMHLRLRERAGGGLRRW